MKYTKQLLNMEVDLQRRSKGDRIGTFKTKQLRIGRAPQYHAYRVYFRGGVTVEAYSNRADGSSLSISFEKLPRFIAVPRVGRPTRVIVMAVERLY